MTNNGNAENQNLKQVILAILIAVIPVVLAAGLDLFIDHCLNSPQPTVSPTIIPTNDLISKNKCIPWTEADEYIGQEVCVWGVVYEHRKTENAFFINFSHYDKDSTDFFGVSFDHEWQDLDGECIVLTGTVEWYLDARPEIIIEQRDQLAFCQ